MVLDESKNAARRKNRWSGGGSQQRWCWLEEKEFVSAYLWSVGWLWWWRKEERLGNWWHGVGNLVESRRWIIGH